jgi:hypothetical protein
LLPRDDATTRAFLFDAKKAISEPGRLRFIPTDKNRAALAELGFAVSDVIGFVKRLETKDHHSGPEADRDGTPGRVMVFLRPYMGKLLYVKLKLYEVEGETQVTILSFHEEGQHG